jgi:hypothetical protein
VRWSDREREKGWRGRISRRSGNKGRTLVDLASWSRDVA